MSDQSERGKTILFVDNSYAFSGMRSAGWRFSWIKLMEYLEEDGPIWKTHFFASEHRPPKDNQRNFYSMLNHQLGFELHLGETKQKTVSLEDPTGRSVDRTIYLDKGLDVRLVTWLLKLLVHQAYDTAMVMSGDGDYIEAVRTVKDVGCRIELIGWRNSVSKELEDLADKKPILYLDDIRAAIERDDDHLL